MTQQQGKRRAFFARLAGRQKATLPWGVRWASWRFSGHRSAYYQELASLLEMSFPSRSLLEIFQTDAVRAQAGGCRAVLTQWWASRYLMTGANLAQTFASTLPAADVACLAMTQTAGQSAMVQMLRTMARRTRTLQECQRDFFLTTMAGVIATVVALLVLTLLPLYTAPQLVNAFSSVSPQAYRPWTRSMLSWTNGIHDCGIWVAILMVVLMGLWFWARQNWTGRVRERFDQFGFWRQTRDYEATCFLSLTSTLVQTLGSRGLSLRAIVGLQLEFARPWLHTHLLRMLTVMDMGAEPLDAMATGLVQASIWSDLQNSVHAQGLTQGFADSADQVLRTLANRMKRQSVIIRWGLLMVSVVIVLFVAYWHVCVFGELRQTMMLQFSMF